MGALGNERLIPASSHENQSLIPHFQIVVDPTIPILILALFFLN